MIIKKLEWPWISKAWLFGTADMKSKITAGGSARAPVEGMVEPQAVFCFCFFVFFSASEVEEKQAVTDEWKIKSAAVYSGFIPCVSSPQVGRETKENGREKPRSHWVSITNIKPWKPEQ